MMTRQVWTWVLIGSVTASGTALAQGIGPVGLPGVVTSAQAVAPATFGGAIGPAGRGMLGWSGLSSYTGLLTPFGWRAPSIPTDRIIPAYSTYLYPVPQPVYVPVYVPVEQPAIQPVQVSVVTLRADAAPTDLRVQRGAVVSWMNSGQAERTLVVEPTRVAGVGIGAERQSGVARPGGSYSLAFHQPGVYQYYLQDRPASKARIIVEEKR